MIRGGFKARTVFNPRKTLTRFERAERRFLFRAGSYWKTIAARRIRSGKSSKKRKPAERDSAGRFLKREEEHDDSAPPNGPPNSHTGRLKSGIRYEVIGDRVLGGVPFKPSKNRTGPRKFMKYLEHGGTTPDGHRYMKRPVLAPALRKADREFPRLYADAMSKS